MAADAVLSVEVRARLEKLSSGLKQGEKSIEDFVTVGNRDLSKIEAKFASLGKTTKDIASNIKSALGGISLDEYMKSFGDNKAIIERSRVEVQKYKEEIERLKKVGQDLTNQIREKTKALNDSKVATQDAKTATENQRKATEAEKTAAAALRKEIAQITLDKRKNAQETKAATGSYREAQQRLTALGRAIREAKGGFDSTNPAIKAQIVEYSKLNQKLKEFDATLGNHQRNVGHYRSGLLGVIPVIGQFTTVIGLAAAAQQGVQKSFSTNLKLDALEYAIQRISGSTKEFGNNLAFLRLSSDRLGIEFISMAESFKMWQGAVQYSNITSEQSRDIFESVANAGAKMKLSTDEVKGTFLALSQMISKGTVSMEELRRQLGDRLPGAFSLAAKAMNMSEMELNKLVSSGQLMSEEFLPKFAKQLDIAFSNDKVERVESLQASVARLKTEWDMLFKSDVATGFFKEVTGGLASLLKIINSNEDSTFSLRGEYARTEDQFHKTYRNVVLLTQEYDNLKSKANLTKEEQNELNNKVREIGELMPEAVLEWGRYGDAISINREKLQGMTKDLLEWRRMQNETTLNSLQSEFKKLDEKSKAYQSILDRYTSHVTNDPKEKKYISDQIDFYRRLATEAGGRSYDIAVELRGTGIVDLSKEQKRVLTFYEGVNEASEKANKSIVKNKEYWESQIKSLQKSRDSLTLDKKGSEEWNKITESIKVAKKNLDAYSLSQKSLGIGSSENDVKKLKISREKLAKILIDSNNSLNKQELTGIQKTLEAINQKYDNWKRQAIEAVENVGTSTETIKKLEINKQAETIIAVDAMIKKSIKKREEDAKKMATKIADSNRKILSDSINIDLVFARKFDETSAQRNLRLLNAEYKKLANDLEKSLRSQVAIGVVNVDGDNRRDKLQEEYFDKMEDLYKREQKTRLEMVDTRNLFNRSLEQTNILLEENERKYLSGAITLEQYKSTQGVLLDSKDKVIALHGAFENLTKGIGDSFATMLVEGKSFGEGMTQVFKNMVTSIISELMRLAAVKIFGSIFTGGGLNLLGGVLGFSSGGYTGNVGKEKVAGVVHGQEFVFSAAATKRIGVDNLKELHNGNVPSVSDFTPRIAKNNSNFKPSSTSGQSRLSLDVNVKGEQRNTTTKFAVSRAVRFEKKFGRG
ncbi:tape measure protein [Sphingobacterium sp. UT-1RO-CII-1]|uniref:tape measure protein n=1 Tax=Sphingobacterium sp. UT-1RO-CII-1 TaxID=2995225 RepID=UPI00227BF41D|nr:tape measure protein [Sphingobacterium sp. UT-1RO-CII-1]MCY4779488.1 tape measure protein [Sphingobacterium sp. UT-1RO-CII-1]